jgi:acyl-CoA oxidase
MIDLSRDPLFKLDDIHDLTKDQIRERTMAKLCVSFPFLLFPRC